MSIGSIGSAASSTISFDPRDLNKDGKVSAAEIQAYANAHPDLGKAASTRTPTQDSPSAGSKGLLDIYA